MNSYYIVVQEWLYPTESGRDVLADTYDDVAEATASARRCVESEVFNYDRATGCTPTPVEETEDFQSKAAFIITDKAGLEEWWFAAKVIEVQYGVGEPQEEVRQ